MLSPMMKNPYKEEEVYEYTLNDLFRVELVSSRNPYLIAPANLRGFDEIAQLCSYTLSQRVKDIINEPHGYFKTLFNDVIYPRHYNHVIAVSHIKVEDLGQPEPIKYNMIFYDFFNKFIAILLTTVPKYATLLDIYESQRFNLLNKIQTKTTSKARSNLTPQASDLDPYDEAFTNASNTGEAISESDANTIMGRIKEIQDSYNKVLLDWAKEFDGLFGYKEED